MSCLHYQSTDISRERNYYDGPYNHYLSPSYSPRIQTPELYRSGYCTGWRTFEYQGNNVETAVPAKIDPDIRTQTAKMLYKQETPMYSDQIAIEKMQTKLKFLENSNIMMQTRNQNLITENKALANQLREEQNESRKLEKRIAALEEELESERLKLEELKKKAEQASKNASSIEDTGTSTTNIVTKVDRGIHIWAVCMGCQRKLEGCEKQPPTVTITKSELEVLEKDMQTLRDTIIAREEAWDKAMEREQNYRQQLTRLTTETITARHLSETRHEEVKAYTNALSEKELELKSLQKDNLSVNKLLIKLYNCYQSCKGQNGCSKSNGTVEINEKDQRFIEELLRRTSNTKTKQRAKSKSTCSERTVYSIVNQLTTSPRDKSTRTIKDQMTLLREPKR